MTGLLDWLKSLYTVGVQYICWLGLATLVFSHSLEKRKMACLKGSAATAGFLLLGMLAGTVGHFAQDLSVDEIHEQLDNCKRMASDVLGGKRETHVHPAGKAVH